MRRERVGAPALRLPGGMLFLIGQRGADLLRQQRPERWIALAQLFQQAFLDGGIDVAQRFNFCNHVL